MVEEIVKYDKFPDVLTVPQACEILQICRYSLYKLLKADEIKHAKVGNTYRISKKSLINFIEDCF